MPADCCDRLTLQAVIGNKRTEPNLYMLDCHGLTPSMIHDNLDLQPPHLPKHLFIILYNLIDDTGLSPLVRRHQVRGIFYRNDSQELFLKGIGMVLNGYLWLSRKILSSCVRSANENTPQPSASTDTAAMLSNRETEILRHIAFGDSNQEIADALKISLHTVKAHLYKIYKKINVPNRLQAALWATTFLETNAQS